ncbi:phosphonate-transporting ATPase [Levilactobacillus namurensis DSM 19117]|uniref:Phosphonate-transporting ATPase n=1 Tax=Levilactobacillus namurensis DSM 19117 TaxID=1423773 RepID=A0A0R1JQR9_9LACO|nr:ABC transporter ATP-binding protein/permease [Levilactobacillus namurensis]KRK73647.1 phosphonate-transporting ATPase [Levilactobacillus namurensis DSM 19117]GEO74424.1 ABC transporter ATP-binding protein [Levilactobacillus namurensis]
MSFLELKDIRKSYRMNKSEFPVLKGISLEFDRGEFVSILGESGGGKTTLMNIIGGLDAQYEGDVLLNGQSLRQASTKQLDTYRRQTIGFIFQNFNLISHLSILDNVMVSLQMTKLSRKEQRDRATDLLDQVGLKEHRHKHPNQLSGGQKQRVAIARALASDPDIIIADEPTGALDSQNTKEILALMDDIAASGKLVICVTHSQEVADHGTRIVHMADGVIDHDTALKDPFPVKDGAEMPAKHLGFGATVRMALQHMRYNLGRNLLIIFGASIGIFSVILMLGLGKGVKGYINHEIYSQIKPTAVQVAQKTDSENVKKLEIKDADVQRLKKLSHVKKVQLGFFTQGAQVQSNGTTSTAQMVQTVSDQLLAKSVKKGTRPATGEVMLGKAFAQKFNKKHPYRLIGKKVKVSLTAMDQHHLPVVMTKTLKVSGVSDGSGGQVQTNLQTIKNMYQSKNLTFRANFATVMIDSLSNVTKVQDKIRAMKNSDGKAQYQLTGAGAIVSTLNTYIQLAFYVLAAIAGISLLVSAIMIIVVLYISVSERTKEIGILRALGVRKRDVKNLFLSEAFFLGLFSSILALVFTELVALFANNIANKYIGYAIVSVTGNYLVFGIVVSVVISLIAALAPSSRAAKLDPIEALAYE